MAIGNYEQGQPRGLGNTFLENALAGLGQQAGRGVGQLAGLGISKLGKAVGIGGPSKELIDLLVSQGMSKEQAQAFADLDPRAQQQLLQNLGAIQQSEQQKKAFQEFEKPQNAVEQQLETAAQEPENLEPVVMPSYRDIYADLTRSGVNEKTIKNYLKEYPKELEDAMKKPKEQIELIDKGAKAAKEGNPRLLRMYELVKNGKLSGSTTAAFVQTLGKGFGKFGLGIDLGGALLSTDSEEFQKLSADFSKLISNYFPTGKITNVMIDQFMKTIPTLLQSDEGKLRVINNLMNINTAAMLNEKAKKEILKQTKGKIPLNLEELIQAKVGPELDVLAEKFARGESVLPEYEQVSEKVKSRSSNPILGAIGGGTAGALAAGPLGIIPGAIGGAIGYENIVPKIYDLLGNLGKK